MNSFYRSKKKKYFIPKKTLILTSCLSFVLGIVVSFLLFYDPIHADLKFYLQKNNIFLADSIRGEVLLYSSKDENYTTFEITDVNTWSQLVTIITHEFDYDDFSFHFNKKYLSGKEDIAFLDSDKTWIYNHVCSDPIITPLLKSHLHKVFSIDVVINNSSRFKMILYKEGYLWTNMSGNKTVYKVTNETISNICNIFIE